MTCHQISKIKQNWSTTSCLGASRFTHKFQKSCAVISDDWVPLVFIIIYNILDDHHKASRRTYSSIFSCCSKKRNIILFASLQERLSFGDEKTGDLTLVPMSLLDVKKALRVKKTVPNTQHEWTFSF